MVNLTEKDADFIANELRECLNRRIRSADKAISEAEAIKENVLALNLNEHQEEELLQNYEHCKSEINKEFARDTSAITKCLELLITGSMVEE